MSVEFFKMFKADILNNINTGLAAKVLDYNSGTRLAKVEPLYKVDNKPLPVLENVPVLRHVGSLEVGQIVYLSISKYSLDEALKGRKIEPLKRKFNLIDAVVVGVF